MRAFVATSVICLATATLFAIPALAAEKAAQTNDVRCLLVAMRAQSSSDEQIKTASTVMSYYYLGRLDGRTPKLDLQATMITEVDKLTPDIMKSDAKRCSDELQARANAIATIGQSLTRHVQQKQGAAQ